MNLKFALPRTPRLELRVAFEAARVFLIRPRSEFDSGMLHEDAADLFNHGGMIQANVEAVYERLRGDAVDMRAPIGNDPVGAVGPRRVAKVRNDRMGADRRIDAQVAECREERMPRGKFAGARRELAA
jgi:hypothetical protein